MSEEYVEFFNTHNPFTQRCGIELTECAFARAVAVMPVEPARHYNGAGIVHGGALLALADFVSAAAANAGGELTLSCGGAYAFHRSGKTGPLTAVATLVSDTRTFCYHRVEIRSPEGELLFTGTMQGCHRGPHAPAAVD